MLLTEQLEELADRLVPSLQGICTEDRLKELLGRYNQAYPEYELTDAICNCVRPGLEVTFAHPGISQTTGRLLVGLRRSTQNHDGVVWKITHVVVDLDGDRHVRVEWKNVRHPSADHHGTGAAS